MPFLKYLGDLEQEKAMEAELRGKPYEYIINKDYRWASWAAPKKEDGFFDHDNALTGDDFIEYVDGELFPYLRGFKQRASSADAIEYKIGEIFGEIKSKFQRGYNLRDALELVDQFRFRSQKEKHELSALYEEKMKRMGNAGRNGGEYYTPRPLIRAMVQVVDPKNGERIYDGAAGSAGFLCESHDHLRRGELTTTQLNTLQTKTFYAKEKKSLAYVIGIMNMGLHGTRGDIMSIKSKLRNVGLTSAIGLIVVIAVLAVLPKGGDPMPPAAQDLDTTRHKTVAVFGATGTVGDGLLKAAVNDPEISKIYIVTRRSVPRIEEAVASGKAEMITHTDYLDYAPLRDMLAEVDTVFWAIGITGRAVTKDQYGVIHVDFPVTFVEEWLDVGKEGELSFHYISGSSTSEDSSWHWAREKARAERTLFDLADGSKVRVISYRPAAVIHSTEMAGFGDKVIEFVFEPFKLAVRSTVIGRAMLEVAARGTELPHRTILENRNIRMYGAGYSERMTSQ